MKETVREEAGSLPDDRTRPNVAAQTKSACQELYELFSTGPTIPGRRTYTLEHIDGEWVFRRQEIELILEKVYEEELGPDLVDDDRRFGFKLP